MKITDGEKLILLMLSEIYDALKIRGEIEPDFIRSAIFSDKMWSIHWKYSGIPFENEETPEIVKEVLDILDMWSTIEYSYRELSEDDKKYLEKEAEPFGKDPKFIGFDGNNETEYMSTASFIVNKLERFEEFAGRDFNSHCPLVEAYRRMLRVFDESRDNLSFGPLSAKQLANILKEKIHPENRNKA